MPVDGQPLEMAYESFSIREIFPDMVAAVDYMELTTGCRNAFFQRTVCERQRSHANTRVTPTTQRLLD
ncbi:MAG: hypothetical protein AAF802_31490, partial [Planctomycetota bacterium]